MLSRVAETIYWIGRYLERAEDIARLIKVNTNLMLDLPKGINLGWKPLIRILGCESAYAEHHEEITERRVVNFVVFDEDNPGSLLSTLGHARENARTIRDILPREAWEELNTFHQRVIDSKQSGYSRQGRHDYLQNIISTLQQYSGLLAGTMNRDTAYSFLVLGRKVERADMISRIINVQAESPIPEEASELHAYNGVLWMSMLESLSGYQMYRQSMQARIRRTDILTFLFQRTEFPRSIHYCTNSIAKHLAMLPNNSEPEAILQHIERILVETDMATLDDERLHTYIDELQICFGYLHNSIAESYFPPALTEAA